ncbi:arsenate reductase/protein-tyrosine-phosphatase family protein [Afifella pfennigii]|uniref:arsenate reductase/protein-tyrosine-phosphatase family protein n=1 Tax=Afifella pfennigii TaxID=209897 RepID=UPI00054F8715|nr:arsenate reductase [Afifella pfennigii]
MSLGVAGRPASILFLCGRNSVRSPMAEALARQALGPNVYVASAGIAPGRRDPFVDAVLAEAGLSPAEREPQSLEDLEDLNFDLAITLSPEAHHRALELTRTTAIEVEYWPTPDPTLATGSREQILGAYRALRERLARQIRARLVEGSKAR